ncbi:MAG: adenine-specific methyltransferase EcoRI family protein [Synergistaceae bacterium]|nr:adenine-specific methyltransferase EcoRI family protein [Synergistaceae bacterium]
MAKNKALNDAAKAKQDEFYTELHDIEDELKYYKSHFEGKVIFCNCDDPYESNFFKFFAMRFNDLKLKKLIASCYDRSPIAQTQLSLFEEEKPPQERTPYFAKMIELDDFNADGAPDLLDVEWLLKNKKDAVKKLKGNGDFRSEECIELLKQADIVVTNPPFSLFREYVAQLMEYDKKFIILGNQNAITYKEIFKLIMENKLWLGLTNGDKSFKVPDYYEPRATRYWQDENGQKYRSMGNMCWFTNLEHRKRHEKLILYRRYYEDPSKYPEYDNYDAIEVSNVSEIPEDYDGVMGVPITFLDKYNPDQFEIIGLDRYTVPKEFLIGGRVAVNGKPKYARILIRRKK